VGPSKRGPGAGGIRGFRARRHGGGRQFLAEDTRWHFPGQNPLSGDYEGVAEVLGVFGKVFELSGGTFQSELHDVLANDEHIVMLVTDRAERLGRKLDDNVAQVFHVRDGKVTDVWIHHTDQSSVDAFWS
jgi:ketosteroid isomerase-like protein